MFGERTKKVYLRQKSITAIPKAPTQVPQIASLPLSPMGHADTHNQCGLMVKAGDFEIRRPVFEPQL